MPYFRLTKTLQLIFLALWVRIIKIISQKVFLYKNYINLFMYKSDVTSIDFFENRLTILRDILPKRKIIVTIIFAT